VIYLLRHGDAEDGNGDDAARRLTPKGERQAKAAARGNVLLVGHEPDFSNELARLTGAKAKLRKGGLAIVDGGTLLASLRPADLAAIAAGG
jgi:phosphohistidine phosphatase SixA